MADKTQGDTGMQDWDMDPASNPSKDNEDLTDTEMNEY